MEVPKQNFSFPKNIKVFKEIDRVTSLAEFNSLSSIMLSFAFVMAS